MIHYIELFKLFMQFTDTHQPEIRMFRFSISLMMTLTFALAAFSTETTPAVKYQPGTVIVKMKNNNSLPARALPRSIAVRSVKPLFQQTRASSLSDVQPAAFYIVKFDEALDARRIAAEISQSDLVEYAQPDYLHTLAAVPNDPDYSAQPFWSQISAPEAWDVTQGDSTVVIAILDTGVDWNHPDLAADIWTNEGEIADDGIDNDHDGKIDDVHGWDFVDNASGAANGEDGDVEDNDPSDYNGHGTHVAGLAAAVTNNGVGVAGGGWNCEIMPLRVGYQTQDGTGSILTTAVLKALQYCVDHGAAVLNASFGGPFDDLAERDMMRYAFDHGVVVVKAAGNSNSDIGYTPDNSDFVISAASVRSNDQKAAYSNFGEWVKISAPGGNRGVGLRSTYPNNRYTSIWGTSMASPVVAGIAGLVKSVHPDWSAAQVMMHLVDTADNIDALNPKYAGQLGKKGRINAYNAVSQPFASQPEFEIAKVSVQDLLHGANGDQRVNIGETADLLLRLRNRWNDAENVNVELTTTDPFVTVVQGNAFFESAKGVSAKVNYVENVTDMFTIAVDSSAFPHNMKFQLHITADGGFEQMLEFQIALEARLLFVDDDDGVRNVQQYWFDVLDSLGMPYDVWDYATQGRTGSLLRRYDLVIWSCENALPTLLNEDRSDLQTYLRFKHHLLIAGQNIGWDLNAQQTADEGQAMNYFNQYNLSSGKSKTFYENYLHARFENDKSSYSFVQGHAGDPIADGLEFAVTEPQREIAEQSPDVISQGGNAKVVFEYPNGSIAAIRHDDGAKVVNFAFGGIEAIADEADRLTVMSRLLDYFTGIKLSILGVGNIENLQGDFLVDAKVASEKSLQSINLYWRVMNQSEYNEVAMSMIDDSTYQAAIPRQPQGAEIEYAVQAVAGSGMYTPVTLRRFIVQSSAPELAVIDLKKTSLNRRPFVKTTAHDESGVDSASVRVIFWTPFTQKDSLMLQPLGGDSYGGEINGSFKFGDSLYYQFAATDLSPAAVRGASPVYAMQLGLESFEAGLDDWQVNENEWGLTAVRSNSGDYSIHETGDSATPYPNNADIAITLLNGLDLSQLDQATLSLWTMYGLSDEDIALVEASSDNGATWTPLGLPIAGASPKFYEAQVSLDAFTGPGNENVLLRFRLVSNETGAGPGWFVDDISLLPLQTDVAAQEEQLPREFRLQDNYPNPFNAGTTIRFALPREANVQLALYNTLGQKIKTLAAKNYPAGVHAVSWDGLNNSGQPAPSGLYFYKMTAENFAAVKKLTMIK